jgi:chemotaxis protein methyltransferase CheR
VYIPGGVAYRLLKENLIRLTGLAYYANRDELLAELIGARLSALGLRDCFSYTEFLAGGQEGRAEMDILIGQLAIGETYFFRDAAQFTAIRQIILPALLERNKASMRLRIWSAGCATGAEPYSLAILLRQELGSRAERWEIGIHATDLNRSYLKQAEEGQFREWALRCTSDQVRRECFSKDGPFWSIHPRYKQSISFHHMNLAASEFSPPWAADFHFDLILCRNVMIYFTPEMSHRLIGQLHESLRYGGWLVVGAAEHNLANYTAFRTANTSGAIFYEKTTFQRGEIEMAGEPAEELRTTLLPPCLSLATPAITLNTEGLRQLADCGDWQHATEYGHRLLTQDRLNPSTHFYQALISENVGTDDQSERSLRQAIYLDRKFALAHYHLGLVLKRRRKASAAARSFGNVLTVLEDMPAEALVTGGPGITVIGLRQLAKMHLDSPNVEQASTAFPVNTKRGTYL